MRLVSAGWVALASLLSGCTSGSSAAQSSSGGSTGSEGGAGGAGGQAVVWEPRCHERWCLIPAGTFIIGSPETEWGRGAVSEDQVPVTLTRAFVLQQYEVTISEWLGFGWANPSTPVEEWGKWCQEGDCPGNLNWFDVVTYANALSERDGRPPCYVLSDCTGAPGEDLRCNGVALTASTVYDCPGYRLATEAEWEYAARAGTTTAYYSGDVTPQPDWGSCYPEPNLEAIAWYCNNSGKTSHPVGQKQPNAAGLYDILGNGMEWTHNDPQGGTARSR